MNNEIKLSETLEDIVLQMSLKYKGEDNIVSSRDVELSDEVENDLPEYLKTLQEAGFIEKYEYYFPGAWQVTITPELLTYFVDKDKKNEEPDTETESGREIVSDVSKDLISDNAQEETQKNIDLKAVGRLVRQIKKYNIVLEAEFGPNVSVIRELAQAIDYMISTGEAQDMILPALLSLRDEALKTGNGIITNGIYHMIQDIL